jgi:hypothetical protein
MERLSIMMNRMSGFHDKLLAVCDNFAVKNEKEIVKPPKVDFAPAPAKPQVETQGAASVVSLK